MDYEKDYNEILMRLEALKNAEHDKKSFDSVKEGCNKMVYEYLEKKDRIDNPQLFNTLNKLEEKGFEPGDLMDIAMTLVNESVPYIKNSNSEFKQLNENTEAIKKEIAKIMLSDAKTSGITERSKHFPHFGTVSCKLTPVAVVEDKSKVIECVSKDETLRNKYLSLSKTITKYKDVKKIDGIKIEDEYIVTVKGEK